MSIAPFFEQFPNASKREIERIAGDYLIKTVVSSHVVKDPSEIEILRAGKPRLKNSEIQFNLSHSEDWILLGVGEMPLGVDIQKISSIREKVMEAYYTESEKELVKEYGVTAFYEIWTKKESYVKYTGEGIKGLKNAYIIPPEVDFFTDIVNGYQIAVCSEIGYLPKKIEIVKHI